MDISFFGVSNKTGSPLVRSYLLGHALELFLKTYLHWTGMGEAELSKHPFGHNLCALLNEARKRRFIDYFRLSPELQKDIIQFDKLYSGKTLEYFSILHILAPPTLPKMSRIRKFVMNLDKTLLTIATEKAYAPASAKAPEKPR